MYCLVSVIKFRRLRWAGTIARIEEVTNAFKILTGKPTGKRLLEDVDVNGRTVLEWNLRRLVSIRGIGLMQLRIGIIGEPL